MQFDGGQRSDLKVRHPQYCAEGQAYWTGKTEATSSLLVGDKGYDSQTIRRTLDAPSAHHTSHPKRKNAKCKPRFNRGLYRERKLNG